MDLEVIRYKKLVELYPSSRLYCPDGFGIQKNTTNYFDINLTRYLYIKTYNSVPPENIWFFNELLGNQSAPKISNNLLKENSHKLDIKIGILKDQKFETQIISLDVKPSDTFEKVKNELETKDLKHKLILNEKEVIKITEPIGQTNTIYVIC
jgi:hypothetical protein